MLKGIYFGKYRKTSQKTGEVITMFKYALTGSEAELSKYKKAIEDKGFPTHVVDEDGPHKGKLIFFSPNVHHGNTCEVQVSPQGAVFVANDTIDILESKLRLINDPALKAAMAQRIADMILGAPAPKAAAVEVAPEEVSAEEANLED